MDVAALIAWLVTAGGGFFLFGTWLAKGGMSRDEGESSRFPPALILGHAGFAAAGLLVWVGYLASDENQAIAWAALALLVPVALLGFTMFAKWIRDRQARATAGRQLAEQRFPVVVVGAHGLLAIITVVLVLLAAIDATS